MGYIFIYLASTHTNTHTRTDTTPQSVTPLLVLAKPRCSTTYITVTRHTDLCSTTRACHSLTFILHIGNMTSKLSVPTACHAFPSNRRSPTGTLFQAGAHIPLSLCGSTLRSIFHFQTGLIRLTVLMLIVCRNVSV